METLGSPAEIGVWVQALLRGSGGITPGHFWDCVCKILRSSAFWPENCSQCHPQWVLRHFNNHGSPQNDPWPIIFIQKRLHTRFLAISTADFRKLEICVKWVGSDFEDKKFGELGRVGLFNACVLSGLVGSRNLDPCLSYTETHFLCLSSETTHCLFSNLG